MSQLESLDTIESVADRIRARCCEFAVIHSGHVHREGHYSMALCGRLWPEFGDRMLRSTGLYYDAFEGKLDPEIDALRRRWLRKKKDLFADLLLTAAPYLEYAGEGMCSLAQFADTLPITHVYEFKYFSSFPSLPRNALRRDAMKLRVLGNYLRNVSGITPHLELIAFNFPDSSLPRLQRKAAMVPRWMHDDGFNDLIHGVCVTVIDHQGNATQIC